MTPAVQVSKARLQSAHDRPRDAVMRSSAVVGELGTSALKMRQRLLHALPTPGAISRRMLVDASEIGIDRENPANHLHPATFLRFRPLFAPARHLP